MRWVTRERAYGPHRRATRIIDLDPDGALVGCASMGALGQPQRGRLGGAGRVDVLAHVMKSVPVKKVFVVLEGHLDAQRAPPRRGDPGDTALSSWVDSPACIRMAVGTC